MVWAVFVTSLVELLAGPWPSLDWLFYRDHSAEWWMVGITFLVFIAALIAWRTAQMQLRSSLRPLVVLNRVALDADHLRFLVAVKNIGPGPALNVKVRVWPRIPSVKGNPSEARLREIEAIKRRVDLKAAPYFVALGALGPMDEQPAFLKRVGDVGADGSVDAGFFGVGGVILYTIAYQDVFGTTFPRKRRLTGQDLGHHQPEVQ